MRCSTHGREREIGEIKIASNNCAMGRVGALSLVVRQREGLKGRWVWGVIVVLWYGVEGKERREV